MRLFTFIVFMWSSCIQADTMDNYMNISNQIPQMLMKADQQSQVWARSARSVLEVTHETIAETLIEANELAKAQGKELFCLPFGVQLNAETLNNIIQQTYKEISSQQADKDKMTVSQIASMGIRKAYPCNAQSQSQSPSQKREEMKDPFEKPVPTMQHVTGLLGK